jgi:peptidoglycan/xylan/chitin deacetylase (PgdA/CDA1 family)
LGQLTAGPGWRVPFALAAVRCAFITRALLAAPGWVASKTRRLPICRGVAARILKARNSFYFFCGASDEAGGWEDFRREFAMRLPVLCYHNVGAALPGSWPLLTVSPQVFERQVKWLRDNGYTGIHASDWLAWTRSGTPLPDKPVLITFDDGYSDLITNAIPTLEASHVKATIFIVSQHVGAASTWDVALGHPSRPLMTEAEIRDCPAHGIEIGAHTRTHPDLRKLQDADLKTEFEGCRKELTTLMARSVNTLAYPFGFQNEQVRKAASETYDLAFSCRPGLNAWRTDPHHLRRMFVHRSRVNFAMQVEYGLDLLAVCRFAWDRATLWLQGVGSRRERAGTPVHRPTPANDNL